MRQTYLNSASDFCSVDHIPHANGRQTNSQNKITRSGCGVRGVGEFLITFSMCVYVGAFRLISGIMGTRECSVHFVEFVMFHVVFFMYRTNHQIAEKTQQQNTGHNIHRDVIGIGPGHSVTDLVFANIIYTLN